jgi:hypothetical protein
MKLFVGLGRIEMSTWMYWWQEELEGLNAEARELEATIALNVAGAYGRGVGGPGSPPKEPHPTPPRVQRPVGQFRSRSATS